MGPKAKKTDSPKPRKTGSSGITTLNEGPLHADLKQWYAAAGDLLEQPVDGYFIDLVRPGAAADGGDLLIEIQTANFSSLKRKLHALTKKHHLRLVYPIAREKWLVKFAKDGVRSLGRRKSPKRGTIENIFDELIRIPALLKNPRFSFEALLIQEEEVRHLESEQARRRRWRSKGWVTDERRLLQVVEQRLFETPADLLALVPAGLAEPFTTGELAESLSRPRWVGQKMAYCLRALEVIRAVGKQGNAVLYERAPSAD